MSGHGAKEDEPANQYRLLYHRECKPVPWADLSCESRQKWRRKYREQTEVV
jgi:hypothetical protein